MKKIIFLLIILPLLIFGCTNSENISEIQKVEVECVKGIVNDPYPGSCYQYIDKDGNDICDLSE